MSPDQEAEFREFVAARSERLCRFAYLVCGDRGRAEDAVQKALTKLALTWPKRRIANPDAYVRRIVVNAVNDERRLGWFRRERLSWRLPEHASPDPGEVGALRVTILSALSRLPHRQRIAVLLRHWEDQSVERTAEIMGCSTGNVKSQTARGLQTLRGLLQESVPTQAEGAAQ
ncbi:MAG: SigE family RNA polymerase sigma factor [Stackebrandtia sp.]